MLRIEIIDGPNKMDLMLALFDHPLPNGEWRSVRFRTKKDMGSGAFWMESFEATINGCKRVPGPEVWEIAGEVKIPRDGHWLKFTGTYSTPKRIGEMEVED